CDPQSPAAAGRNAQAVRELAARASPEGAVVTGTRRRGAVIARADVVALIPAERAAGVGSGARGRLQVGGHERRVVVHGSARQRAVVGELKLAAREGAVVGD